MPTNDEANLVGLFVKDWHREDSRPGSWCMRIGAIGKRAVYHLEYNPHGDADWRTIFGPGEWVEDAKGNADALLKIAIHAGTRSGADAGVSSKQPKRVSATTPADHEPETSQQPLFPSAAVAAEIIALLDERAAALPGPPEPSLPPLAPRAREPLVRHPRPTGYVAADDFS